MAVLTTPAAKAARLTQKALSGFQSAHDSLVQAATLHVDERDHQIEQQAFYTEKARLAGTEADVQHTAAQTALAKAESLSQFLG